MTRQQTRFLACGECGCTSLQVGVIHWCTLVHDAYWVGDQERASWSLGPIVDVDAEADDPSVFCERCGWSESLQSCVHAEGRDDLPTFGLLARAIREHVTVLERGTVDAIERDQRRLRELVKRLP